jgi:thiamine biosynthesis lipoprotein
MATEFRLVFYADADSVATTAAERAFRRIAQLDHILSDYSDDSELTLLNRRAGGGPTDVGEDLWTVLVRSDQIASRTQGAFDVTVGPSVRLWRRARRTRTAPTDDQIAAALERVGASKLRLDPRTRQASLDKPGMRIDLGGIAKGYACQQALDLLKSLGAGRAMVVGGGEVALAGPPPGEVGWTIAIQPPAETLPSPVEYLNLCHASVSTSGDSSQFVVLDGTRYSHIVDPRDGRALTHRRQATVVAPDGMTADALSSAMCVLGTDGAEEVLEQFPGVACRIDDVDSDGRVRTWRSRTWPRTRRTPPETDQVGEGRN